MLVYTLVFVLKGYKLICFKYPLCVSLSVKNLGISYSFISYGKGEPISASVSYYMNKVRKLLHNHPFYSSLKYFVLQQEKRNVSLTGSNNVSFPALLHLSVPKTLSRTPQRHLCSWLHPLFESDKMLEET